ncbi:hypothetical protein EXIGLDRAFT_734552 [Exidia glandulosa HHB12029]|uniref:Uncharacterized protein n=1 Tax=Exidia glandulosa HHB12029 TaxID=1314781 RepID=A0A165PNL3_EXIGL|nr:hypothetical protein EXIGLDRAFT_734552 [Exidia glandulosa HHB12029]
MAGLVRPFPPSLVNLTLEHLTAPERAPLPREFLSPALAHRHRRQQLKPSDAAYYAWPVQPSLADSYTSNPTRVLDALAALHEADMIMFEGSTFVVRYSPSLSGLKAMVLVRVPGGEAERHRLVLVFAWDPTDEQGQGGEWKFHDARLFVGGKGPDVDALPPDAGYATLEEAVAEEDDEDE